MKTGKERLDVLLVTRALTESRELAKRKIMAGEVFVNGQREDKPGTMFDPEKSTIEVRGEKPPYVSRGGFKLEKALKVWPIALSGKTCGDIGSSTGGFTDCMLQNGAQKVFAIDVGTNQLAWVLRQNPKVVSMEKTNIRYVTREDLGVPLDFASVDVSFISLKKVLPVLFSLLGPKGEAVCLVKPQFEAGREKVGKKGVVREAATHKEVLEEIMKFSLSTGFTIGGVEYSPIKGPEGNIEYLLLLQKSSEPEEFISPAQEEWIQKTAETLVGLSHEALAQKG